MDATESIRKECREYAQNAAVIVDGMQAEKAEIPVVVGDRNYLVTVLRVYDCHMSDCAVHNMPAYPNGPCDCTANAGRQP